MKSQRLPAYQSLQCHIQDMLEGISQQSKIDHDQGYIAISKCFYLGPKHHG